MSMQNEDLQILLKEFRRVKKYIRYEEGAEIYSMSTTKFRELAKRANAVYKIDKLVMVNCQIFEDFMQNYRLQSE